MIAVHLLFNKSRKISKCNPLNFLEMLLNLPVLQAAPAESGQMRPFLLGAIRALRMGQRGPSPIGQECKSSLELLNQVCSDAEESNAAKARPLLGFVIYPGLPFAH